MKNKLSKLKTSYVLLISLIFLIVISSAFILLCRGGSFPTTVRLMTSFRFAFIILLIIDVYFIIYLSIKKRLNTFRSVMLTLIIFFASGILYGGVYSYISTTPLPFLFGVTPIGTLGMFAKGILMLLSFGACLVLCGLVYLTYSVVKHIRKNTDTH